MRNVLETGQYRNKVRNDFIGGVRSGVNGTPTFFINGVRHDGAYDYAPWYRQSKCVSPPIRPHSGFGKQTCPINAGPKKGSFELTMVSAAPRSGDYARSYA